MIRIFASLAAFAGCAAILSAQAIDPDTFKVNYLSHIRANDSAVYITNAGTTAQAELCADIYVFDPNQELSECCSCQITPDGLLTLSGEDDLTANPLTGVYLNAATVKIVSSSTCDATKPAPASGIHAWATHLEGGEMAGAIVETSFLDAGLSSAELTALGKQCKAIKTVGSGKGVCRCPPIESCD